MDKILDNNFNNIIETFDGIRKDNSRMIFGILLLIITIDIVTNINNSYY